MLLGPAALPERIWGDALFLFAQKDFVPRTRHEAPQFEQWNVLHTKMSGVGRQKSPFFFKGQKWRKLAKIGRPEFRHRHIVIGGGGGVALCATTSPGPQPLNTARRPPGGQAVRPHGPSREREEGSAGRWFWGAPAPQHLPVFEQGTAPRRCGQGPRGGCCSPPPRPRGFTPLVCAAQDLRLETETAVLERLELESTQGEWVLLLNAQQVSPEVCMGVGDACARRATSVWQGNWCSVGTGPIPKATQ